METWEESEAERNRLKAAYGSLYESVLEALFRHDPICINYGNNTDEYEPEVGTILPRLETCRSPEEEPGELCVVGAPPTAGGAFAEGGERP